MQRTQLKIHLYTSKLSNTESSLILPLPRVWQRGFSNWMARVCSSSWCRSMLSYFSFVPYQLSQPSPIVRPISTDMRTLALYISRRMLSTLMQAMQQHTHTYRSTYMDSSVTSARNTSPILHVRSRRTERGFCIIVSNNGDVILEEGRFGLLYVQIFVQISLINSRRSGHDCR